MRARTLLTFLLAGCGAQDVAPPAAAATESAARSAADRFVTGEVLRYRFDWRVDGAGRTAILPDAAPVAAGLDLAGVLELRVLGPAEGGVLLALSFASLDRHAITMMGQDVLGEPTALLGHRAHLVVRDDGEVRDVWFAADAPSVFRQLAAGVIAQTDLRVLPRGGAPRRAAVPAGSGLADVEYAWAADRRIARTLRGYDRLDAAPGPDPAHVEGALTITLDDRDLPTRLDGEEVVWVAAGDGETPAFQSRTSFSLVREAALLEPQGERPDLAALVHRDLLAPPDDEEVRRAMAQKFAEDLQPLDVELAVRAAGFGLRPREGFMVEATGLLRGWPELTAEVEASFWTEVDPRARELTIDLLSSVDTPESQRAMCRVLGDERTRSLPEHAGWMQRFSFLWRPTPETAAFLVDEHALARDSGDVRARHALLYPMGTVSGRVGAVDPVAAAAMHGLLAAELDEAEDDATVVAALAGLGNAGAPEDLAALLEHAGAADIDVRAQVASSLRFHTDPAATTTLLRLLADPDAMVAASALSVLDGYRLDDDGGVELAAVALIGGFNSELHGRIVAALARRHGNDPWIDAALIAMRARTEDRDERERIDRVLATTVPS